MSAASARVALDELAAFRQFRSAGRNAVLVNSKTGKVIFEHVAG